MAATGAFGLVAEMLKPGGGAATKSPWLAHTRSSVGTSVNRTVAGPSAATVTVAVPNSRCEAGATVPPRRCAINCMP